MLAVVAVAGITEVAVLLVVQVEVALDKVPVVLPVQEELI
jgi:hypothetical protein